MTQLPVMPRAKTKGAPGVVWEWPRFCMRCDLILRDDQTSCPCNHPDPVTARLRVVRPEEDLDD